MADMLIAMQNDNEKIEQLANAQENMNADWNMKQEKHENTKAENVCDFIASKIPILKHYCFKADFCHIF